MRVAVEVLLRRLIRRVGRGEGEVEKERRLGVVALDQLDRVLAEQLRHIALLLDRLVVAEPVSGAMR